MRSPNLKHLHKRWSEGISIFSLADTAGTSVVHLMGQFLKYNEPTRGNKTDRQPAQRNKRPRDRKLFTPTRGSQEHGNDASGQMLAIPFIGGGQIGARGGNLSANSESPGADPATGDIITQTL